MKNQLRFRQIWLKCALVYQADIIAALRPHLMGETVTLEMTTEVWKLELVDTPRSTTSQGEAYARKFESYGAMLKRLPDYEPELDAEMAEAFVKGEPSFLFTLRSGQNKRQFLADFDKMTWRRVSHDATGFLRLTAAAQGMTLRRNIAIAARMPR